MITLEPSNNGLIVNVKGGFRSLSEKEIERNDLRGLTFYQRLVQCRFSIECWYGPCFKSRTCLKKNQYEMRKYLESSKNVEALKPQVVS